MKSSARACNVLLLAATGMLASITTVQAQTAAETPRPGAQFPPYTATTGAQAQDAGVFQTDAILVSGVTVLPSSEVDGVIAPYRGRLLTFAELQRLRIELTALYINAGFVSSGFVLPDQPRNSGTLKINAVEGELGAIEIDSDARLRESYITSRLRRQLKGPLNIASVRNALGRLQNDQNVIRIDAELLPGPAPGNTRLRLSVDEPARFQLGLVADNHHPASIGGEAIQLHLGARNLTGLGEATQLSLTVGGGLDEYLLSSEVPVDARDSTLGLYLGTSNADVTEARFDALEISSKSHTAGLRYVRPLHETERTRLSVNSTLEYKRSLSRLLGERFSLGPGAQDGESKTTSLQLGVEWTYADPTRVITLAASYRRGLNWFGATEFKADALGATEFNPTEADGDFDLYRTQGLLLTRMNRARWLSGLNDRAQLLFRFNAQFSGEPLMSLEKYAVGGADTVRGYRENTMVRDNGWSSTLELQFPVPGYRPDADLRNLVIAPFVDYGQSWDDTNANQGSLRFDTSRKRHIAGAGLGLLWQPLRGLRAQIYWGESISNNFGSDDPRDSGLEYDLQDDGLHFSLAYQRNF